jgi:hypothetical protein
MNLEKLEHKEFIDLLLNDCLLSNEGKERLKKVKDYIAEIENELIEWKNNSHD